MVTQQASIYTRVSDLNERHYEDSVVKRGLDPFWIQVNCRSVSASIATELLGYPAKSDGLWLEGYGYQGQFKPDKPWRSDNNKDKKAPKYRSPLGEYDAMLPRHPHDRDYWRIHRLKELAYKIDGYPCLLITEGFFKAVAACSQGIPTVALLGVEMGLTPTSANPEGKRYLVPELKRLATAGFGFIIGFDADCVANPAVNSAQLKLAQQLKCFEIPTYSITGLWSIEEGKGIDDYLQKNGADRFIRELMVKSLKIETWERLFIHSIQLQQSKTHRTPSPRQLALEIAQKYNSHWAFHDEQLVWRQFNGQCWETLRDGVFAQLVFNEIELRQVEFKSANYVKNTIEILKLKLTVPQWSTWKKTRYIPFENGVLDLNTGELLQHSPRFGFMSYLKREYVHPPVGAAQVHPLERLRLYCPHTYKYMMWAMDSDPKRVLKLLAIINGVVKWRFHDLEMFIHLVGEPGSGKSTFARLLQKMVGKGNYESSSLKKLCNDYEIAKIINTQLVICPDEDIKVGGFGGLKALTGGDTISYRPIYKPAASSPFYGTIAILSNQAIFAGDTTGLDRRICLVSFPNRLTKAERNSNIESLIEAELSHLTWIVLGLSDELIANVLKGIGDLEIPEFKLQAWLLCVQTNSAAAHLEDYLINDPKCHTPVLALYEHYQDFCRKSGMLPMSRERYLQDLVRIATHNLEWGGILRSGVTIEGRRTQVMWGIHIRDEFVDVDVPSPSETFRRL